MDQIELSNEITRLITDENRLKQQFNAMNNPEIKQQLHDQITQVQSDRHNYEKQYNALVHENISKHLKEDKKEYKQYVNGLITDDTQSNIDKLSVESKLYGDKLNELNKQLTGPLSLNEKSNIQEQIKIYEKRKSIADFKLKANKDEKYRRRGAATTAPKESLEFIQENSKKPENISKLASSLAQGFIDSGAFYNHESPTAKNMDNQAVIQDEQAKRKQKERQEAEHIKNRDYRVEAEKNAAAQAATENAQNVANLSAAAGGGAAALARSVKSADYDTHMARQDEMRKQAIERGAEESGAKALAESYRGAATADRYNYNQMQKYNREAENLSKGINVNEDNDNTATGNEPSEPAIGNASVEESSETSAVTAPEDNTLPESTEVEAQGTQIDNTLEAQSTAKPGDWYIDDEGNKVILTQDIIDQANNKIQENAVSDIRMKNIIGALSNRRFY